MILFAKYLQKIKILDGQILEKLAEEQEMEVETSLQDERNVVIEIHMAKMETLLRRARGGTGGLIEATPKRDGRGPSYTKLPKLEIKYFTGNPLEFPTFQQQFQASIGESDLAEVAKFSYLKNLLRGEASRALEGLSVVGENYNSAWNILKTKIWAKKSYCFYFNEAVHSP